MAHEIVLDRSMLLAAFADLGRRAHSEGKTVEISIYGGSALMLTYDWRLATRDVDAVYEADKTTVRRLAAEVAKDRGWNANWLNDGVKGFLSPLDADSRAAFGTYPSEDEPGLRVMVASPAYLFAMKCRAMRIGGADENSDTDDIRKLAAVLGLATVSDALELLSFFYPGRRFEAKVQFGLEEVFDTMFGAGQSGSTQEPPR